MKFAGLISGGKDSMFTVQSLIKEGNELVCLIHLYSDSEYDDSYMYQTVGHEVVEQYFKIIKVPIYTYKTECKTLTKTLGYSKTDNDEVEDLFEAVRKSLGKTHFEAISSGAIASTYQKNRVENICMRLNLISLAPLWGKNQKLLLKQMIDSGIRAMVIKIASPGLDNTLLGKDIREIYEYLNTTNEDNYCGEGGEYETVVLECPLFSEKLICENSEICCHPDDVNKEEKYKVLYLKCKSLKIVDK